jgi:AAA15 family ATPase/GTPase
MNGAVEQSRKILVDDLKTIQERLNNMQAVIEKLPKNAPKRKELEAAFQTLSREAAYVETMLSGLF